MASKFHDFSDRDHENLNSFGKTILRIGCIYGSRYGLYPRDAICDRLYILIQNKIQSGRLSPDVDNEPYIHGCAQRLAYKEARRQNRTRLATLSNDVIDGNDTQGSWLAGYLDDSPSALMDIADLDLGIEKLRQKLKKSYAHAHEQAERAVIHDDQQFIAYWVDQAALYKTAYEFSDDQLCALLKYVVFQQRSRAIADEYGLKENTMDKRISRFEHRKIFNFIYLINKLGYSC